MINRAKLLLLVLLVFSGVSQNHAQTPVRIVIAHTNDLHGQILPRNGVGGIAQIATIVRSMNADLVFDAGDLFTGTYLSDRFEGSPLIRAMNAIGYTAGTIGNHEFDYGQAPLRARLQEARFPLLSANLETPFKEILKYRVVPVRGIRIGVIGVTTVELGTTTHPRNLQNIKVLDVVRSIRGVLPEVRRQSDMIVVIAHITDAEERRIAGAFPEIPLIIGGHNHGTLGPVKIGGTTVAKTGSSGRNVGRVDLTFEGKILKTIEARLIPVERVAADPEVAAVIAPFAAEVETLMAQVVGETTAEFVNSSTSESPLANIVSDAMRQAVGTEIAIQNVGGIRARLPKGFVTWGSVFEVLPFKNTIIRLKLTGAQLRRALGARLLAVSGLKVHWDLRAATGRQLISVQLADGSPVDDRRVYSVATNDFLIAGGDGLSELARGREIEDTGLSLRDAVVKYLAEHRPISPTLDGRITVLR